MTAQDFWSRRKENVEREQQAELAALEEAKVAEAHAELEAKPDEEILAELNLPDPDTMQKGDDFSVFMSKAVPDRVRRRALRVLWKANPLLANLDELVEYGEDYTDSATVVENLQTAYQVGRGMLKHIEHLAEEEAKKAEGETDVAAQEEEEIAPEAEIDVVTSIADAETDDDAPSGEEDEVFAFDVPRPRRMTFRVEETV